MGLRHARQTACCTALFLLLTACEGEPRVAGDASTHELTIERGSATRLVASTSRGAIVVRSGEGSAVEVQATRLGYGDTIEHANAVRDRIEFRLDTIDGQITLGWRWKQSPASGEDGAVGFVITVPVGFGLDLRSSDGDIDVEADAPLVDAVSDSGAVNLIATGTGPLAGSVRTDTGEIKVVVGTRDCVVEGKSPDGGLIFAQGMELLGDGHAEWPYGDAAVAGRLVLESGEGVVRVGRER